LADSIVTALPAPPLRAPEIVIGAPKEIGSALDVGAQRVRDAAGSERRPVRPDERAQVGFPGDAERVQEAECATRAHERPLDRVPFFGAGSLLALEQHFGADVGGADRAFERHGVFPARVKFGRGWRPFQFHERRDTHGFGAAAPAARADGELGVRAHAGNGERVQTAFGGFGFADDFEARRAGRVLEDGDALVGGAAGRAEHSAEQLHRFAGRDRARFREQAHAATAVRVGRLEICVTRRTGSGAGRSQHEQR
jgi:hypothetical protein